MIQVNRIYLIFNRLVTKKFLVDTSDQIYKIISPISVKIGGLLAVARGGRFLCACFMTLSS